MAPEDTADPSQTRDRIIIRTSIIGILANILLASFKAVIGILTNSIAITLDAVNNMSDALSSVVTIIGTKLAGKKPDKKHPLGYGRIEYLSTMIIAAIVLYAGITSLTESISKIINPEVADYSDISLIIVASAIVVKIVLGRYVKHVGEKVNSGSLVASGTDALFDAILSTSVLISAIIFIVWGIGLEAYVGAAISIFIIRSGIEMIRDAVDDILGKREDKEFTDSIKETVCEQEGVTGAYDLILHSYGPDRIVGSVHIEVPASMTAGEIDSMEREISRRVFEKHGIILAGIGIYSNDDSEGTLAVRSEVTRIVMSHDGVLQMHGFRADPETKVMNLDVIIDYALDDREALCGQIRRELEERFPEYRIELVLDIDI